MNFYHDFPMNGKKMLTEYARNMAISYLMMHRVHFRVQLNVVTIVVRMTELQAKPDRFLTLH
jgi:hypothetical protein